MATAGSARLRERGRKRAAPAGLPLVTPFSYNLSISRFWNGKRKETPGPSRARHRPGPGYDGLDKNYCVIGDPIEHSLSPAIYNCLFSRYGMAGCSYSRERVTVQSLPAFISSLAERRICGFNVTMPLKTAVLPYLNYRDASITSGANTVVVEGTVGLAGWSTDAPGFERSLELNGQTFRGSRTVFIGSGGAAQTLITAAVRTAERVTVVNRTPANADRFRGASNVTVAPLAEIDRFMPDCTLLVNCTPLGMTGVPSDFTDLSFLQKLPEAAFVCDLIYEPPQTRFLREAQRLGHDTMNGLWMLIWQAFYAFEKFTGILPDMEAFTAVRAALQSARG